MQRLLARVKEGNWQTIFFFARLPAFVVSSLKIHISDFGALPLSVKVVPFEFQYLYFQFLIFQYVLSLIFYIIHSGTIIETNAFVLGPMQKILVHQDWQCLYICWYPSYLFCSIYVDRFKSYISITWQKDFSLVEKFGTEVWVMLFVVFWNICGWKYV